MNALWYLMRGTGAVSLVLLTMTLALGVANHGRWAPRNTPRFVVDHLHRTASLLVVALLAVHITTAVLDRHVAIDLADAVIPFAGHYRPLWVGLGALSLDLLLALIVTSLLRARIGLRQWKAVHWLAYACWPVAVAHGLGNGTDVPHGGWMLWLTGACAVTVAAAVWARLTRAPRPAATSAPTAPVVPTTIHAPTGALR
ncbi:ferric reductase [Patulibacter sp. NPDC049589]|uniref:ferric reductase n=1 Tax=Patulibacter sp. NPDC049589 TaxID=3154731 RepID=UPI00343104FD